ncbi:MAG: Bug family tripartite tricarboxylate transporter substrate binding protein [Pseudorhodoplanes sp.]
MKNVMMSGLLTGLLAVLPAIASPAAAQDYPTKTIQLIVPFPAGGDIDPIARVLADHLRSAWGQPVVVESRAGAGGRIGSAAVAKSDPDGYTLLMCSAGPITISPSLYSDMPYAPEKDFEPVVLIGAAPAVLLVNEGIPAKTYAEFLKLAQAKPGTITYASSGIGSFAHLTTLAYTGEAGIKLMHVPYKGSAPAVQDLVGGHVNTSFNPMPSALSALTTQKVRPLAVTSAKRSAFLPDVPTLAELGLKGIDIVSWYGICAPKGTPANIVAKLHAEINRATALPAVQERLRALGTETRNISVADFAALLKADAARWSRVVKENGVKVQ